MRVLELTMMIAVAEKEIAQIISEAPTQKKRGRPPKPRPDMHYEVSHHPITDDDLSEIKNYVCTKCEKRVQSRQDYHDLTCSVCKTKTLVQETNA